MKKFYMILAAIAALTMTAQAQNFATVEVGDLSTAEVYNDSYFNMAPTNFYVAHTGVQMLYTPDLLADMNGKQNVMIKALDFWFACETFEEIIRDVKIYLQEVDATEFAVDENGVKQFFTFGELVKEMTVGYEMLNYYGDDVCFNFDFEPFAFTPGKSLLVTMVFDAQDDDNCTMGSDYAAFYTSGIRSHAMTYTNNWNSFVDFAAGPDFPNATVMLGCGTNVELPVTRIGYNYEDAPEPGATCAKPEGSFENGIDFHGVLVTLINNETAEGTELHYNITKDGVMIVEDAIYGEPFALTEDGEYYIDFWATAPDMNPSSHGGLIFTIDPTTGLSELLEGKTVAAVRYFNVAGQEIAQPEGLTIVVTTYTDGTTNAAKVVK